ncbi:hypothetical protein D9611_013955 [Ephemerocybe angulata]|uniref:F-box domain-containing protein n=1 Tax=Ephemerocybe angulata TaxID=980116 RepID=A0A8H5ARZ3_9AGAR|nr:hypothetical protein D9611_013955 [Tulosesus angulatus]
MHSVEQRSPWAALPVEIWLHVFRVVNRSSDDSLYPPEEIVEWLAYKSSLTHRRLKQATKTKRAAVRVCREWNTVLTPLLYEHVILPHVTSFQRVLRTMTERPDLGAHTRRLDLFLEDFDTDSNLSLFHFPAALETIFKATANLQTLVVAPVANIYRSYYFTPLEVGKSLLAGASPSLECIRFLFQKDIAFSLRQMRFKISAWAEFVSAHPNLTSIQRPYTRALRPDSTTPWAPQPPSIHSQHSSVIIPHMCDVDESHTEDPAVQDLRLVLNADNMYQLAVVGAAGPQPPLTKLSVLRIFGAHVVSAHFVFEDPVGVDERSPHIRAFQAVQDACPNLQELGCAFQWLEAVRLETTFPLVHTLMIQRIGTRYHHAYYRHMLNFILQGKKQLPNLKRIWFLDERNVSYMERHKGELQLDSFVSQLGHDGIAVESWEDSRRL